MLTDEDARGMDTRMKMHPPLTGEADRQALIEGLRAGTIDCVATDHAPHARDEKEVPFEQAPMGTTGLETAFAALYSGLVLSGVLDLGVLIERMSAGAALFGLAGPAWRSAPGQPRAARPRASGSPARKAGRAARRTAASPGGGCRGRSC